MDIREIQVPEKGWVECAYYVVEVRTRPTNVPHRSILYTGFLNGPDKQPGGYSCIFNPSYGRDRTVPFESIYSLRVIRELDVTDDRT